MQSSLAETDSPGLLITGCPRPSNTSLGPISVTYGAVSWIDWHTSLSASMEVRLSFICCVICNLSSGFQSVGGCFKNNRCRKRRSCNFLKCSFVSVVFRESKLRAKNSLAVIPIFTSFDKGFYVKMHGKKSSLRVARRHFRVTLFLVMAYGVYQDDF
jgi:hypothetical protein